MTMAQPDPDTPPRSDPGRGGRKTVTSAEIAAAGLSTAWVVGVGLWFLLADDQGPTLDPNGFVFTLMAIFLPVAMIWLGALAARSNRIMREESARLQAAIDAIRTSYIEGQQSHALKPTVEHKLDEIARAARKTETALAIFTSIRETTQPGAAAISPPSSGTARTPEDQGSLALGTPAEALAEPVSVADFLRALNFPENGDDKEGFRALRRALRDRQTAQLISAAQEVLRLLAEENIYMDDLTPDRARPEIWRRFAAGERGRAVAGLGGIRDRSSLALSAGRMRHDPAFRAAVHQFLRRFDEMLLAFEPKATDAEMAQMSDTRTARAFMLLGRVTGTFA